MSDVRAKLLGAGVVAAWAALVATSAWGEMQDLAAGAGAVDPAVRPADDFYGYANGPWLKATRLPEGQSRLDTTSMLRAQNADRVRGLVEDAVRANADHRHPVGPLVRKLADYYASRLDRAGIEARGLAPLAPDLAAIAAIGDRRALSAWLGEVTRLDDGANLRTESLLGLWVHQSFHDPDRYAAHLVQGGLGLAEREDYLDPAPERAARRDLYRAHVVSLLRAAGFDQAEVRADRVLALEVAIAATHGSRADTDDVFKTDNSWLRADFDAKAPGIDWASYFAAAGIGPQARFVVWQPQAVVGAARLVASQPLDAWKDYLAFHLIAHYADVLPAAFGDEARAFDARLAGAAPPPAPPPARDALAATEAALGDAIGRLYVERYFPPQAKAAAVAMTGDILFAYRARIEGLAWMSPGTKAKALAKLASLRVGLGYPEAWIDYASLDIRPGDAFGNLKRTEAFSRRRATARLGHPIDPDEWPVQLHAQDVGAILNLSPNTMQFAAGLLQPPYFDPAGDAAANYGSAGAGIAHEISHSFDEVGNLYDAQGRLGQWWTPQDLTAYRAALAPLAAQLDACCPQPGICTRGQQVVGESSADLVGLMAAHDGYLRSLRGRPDMVKNGLTGDQRFFVAFAQRWRRLQTETALRRQVAGDTHAPPQCRSELARNSDAWADAFAAKPGDRLYLRPEARIRIW